MSRNGSGNYSLPSGNPVVPSTVISSTWANTTLSDIATALTQSIANDGQTTPVANLPMATFRHTNVGNAAARTDYAAAGQVQDSSLQWLTSVAGTDTITASIAPGPSAYVAGQTFRFVAAGANTTTTVTLNINGLGAKNITKRGSTELGVGDIASGQVLEVVYDGTQFQMAAISPGSLLNVQTFTANGTYTPTPGTRFVIVEVQAGGGGGGGTPAVAAGQQAAAAGGSSGGYSRGRITSAFSGVTVTVGAAGTGGAAGQNNGVAGGTSSFGTLIVCTGGGGGGSQAAQTAFLMSAPGLGGTTTTSGNIISASGQPGEPGKPAAANNSFGGNGAPSIFGGGGISSINGVASGVAASKGAGGGGASTVASGPALAGGAGGAGLVIVHEYA